MQAVIAIHILLIFGTRIPFDFIHLLWKDGGGALSSIPIPNAQEWLQGMFNILFIYLKMDSLPFQLFDIQDSLHTKKNLKSIQG